MNVDSGMRSWCVCVPKTEDEPEGAVAAVAEDEAEGSEGSDEEGVFEPSLGVGEGEGDDDWEGEADEAERAGASCEALAGADTVPCAEVLLSLSLPPLALGSFVTGTTGAGFSAASLALACSLG